MQHRRTPWSGVLDVAERLRAQRKTEWRLAARRGAPADGEGSMTRRYTIVEMQHEVPGYKGLYEGRAQRPPTMALIDAIATYLECSLAEQNTLRSAAGLPLVQRDPHGEELRAQLELLLDTLQALPFPAQIVTRDWSIYAVNQHGLTFLGMTAVDMMNIPAEQCTLLHFIFDPRLGLQARLTGGKGGWRAIAERNVSAFWLNNRHVLHEPELKSLLADLRAIPNSQFGEIWDHAQHTVPAWSPFASADYTMEMESLENRAAILKVRVLHIQHGAMAFPSILGYIPAGPDAQRIYAAMGLSAHERMPSIRTAVYGAHFTGGRRNDGG